MDPREILKDCFGYDQFRPGQEKLIRAILSGRDVLGVMPTGGGKSLCYQVPALLLPGITLVISPLISLMKDQVSALTSAGVPAAFLNSSLTGEQLRLVYQRARQGQYKLLYAAPERLAGEGLLSLAREVPISLVAVDEAHCISQWGQDFRPSYLKIAGFAAQLPRRPVVAAFTATATAQVQEDILRLLAMEDPVREVTGFDRPNLYFDVQAPGASAPPSSPSSRPGGTGAASSTAPPAPGWRRCGPICRRRASPPPATTRGWTRRSGGKTRTTFSSTGRPSWWPPTPSAWASTSPT